MSTQKENTKHHNGGNTAYKSQKQKIAQKIGLDKFLLKKGFLHL